MGDERQWRVYQLTEWMVKCFRGDRGEDDHQRRRANLTFYGEASRAGGESNK